MGARTVGIYWLRQPLNPPLGHEDDMEPEKQLINFMIEKRDVQQVKTSPDTWV